MSDTAGAADSASAVMTVALVGCGNISAQYLASLPRLSNLRLVSVTDPVSAAAERVAGEQGVPGAVQVAHVRQTMWCST